MLAPAVATYRRGVKRKTVKGVVSAVRRFYQELGNVLIFINVYAAFDGCAPPIWIKAKSAEALRSPRYFRRLKAILRDHPSQTAYVQPIY